MEEERQRKHGIVVPEQETDVTSAMLARGRMDKQRVAVDLAEQRKVLAAHMHLAVSYTHLTLPTNREV